jgi:hypothetical protein
MNVPHWLADVWPAGKACRMNLTVCLNRRCARGHPRLDVREDADNFIIRAELPGLKREDINVSLQDGALVISGERTVEKVEEGVEVHRQERYYGKFQRALSLPAPVAADQDQGAIQGRRADPSRCRKPRKPSRSRLTFR